jgi:hypothetical protein
MQTKYFLENLINKILKLNSEGFCIVIKEVKVQGAIVKDRLEDPYFEFIRK